MDIRYLILGDSETGKTLFISRLLKENTYNNYIPTLGIEFYRFLTTNNINEYIWDTGKYDSYKKLIYSFSPNINCYIIFCDLFKRDSIDIAISIYNDYKNTDKIFVIIGNMTYISELVFENIEYLKSFLKNKNIIYYQKNVKSDIIKYILTDTSKLIIERKMGKICLDNRYSINNPTVIINPNKADCKCSIL